jgi:hypothetical protein
MTILIFQFNQIEIKTTDIEEYVHKLRPDGIVVRVFISSLYFDTFSIEILFF